MKTIRNLLLSAIMALCGSVFSAGAQEDAGKGLEDVPMVKLNNGVLMPRFGLGTFLQGSDERCWSCAHSIRNSGSSTSRMSRCNSSECLL